VVDECVSVSRLIIHCSVIPQCIVACNMVQWLCCQDGYEVPAPIKFDTETVELPETKVLRVVFFGISVLHRL